ncbi:sugar phosphate isomerase/epimerase family protein [Engelhardtia mirabilis]|uniref:Xylose isomerase-like TIM barrel n=1 Tax=Engelhardtia mirabilis TaxID=2528011 RepID=A0A518BDC5_9BACT|nr:Xylose isomerase-like TIM barrel [Planctomycetes bacterium Pla133]QDU99292.1 Xylose isomerase-like TIM barrel [Planctomycetes bacterium Pla86]
MYRLGYNTNGFAHHRPEEALEVLADLGYEGAAITPDVGALDPLAADLGAVERLRARAEGLGLTLDLETGARFVLDPRRKHFPSLLEESGDDRRRRVDFLLASVDLAAGLGARTLSLWSGRAPCGTHGDAPPGPGEANRREELWTRLVDGLRPVLARADQCGVRVGFEPEPGMFVERPSGYDALLARLGADAEALGLTLDVGHCLCTGDVPVQDVIGARADRLVAVQLDDMRAGDHTHLMFGEGELDLAATLAALSAVGFEGLAAVELSRESHRAPEVAAQAMVHLRAARGGGRRPEDPSSGA